MRTSFPFFSPCISKKYHPVLSPWILFPKEKKCHQGRSAILPIPQTHGVERCACFFYMVLFFELHYSLGNFARLLVTLHLIHRITFAWIATKIHTPYPYPELFAQYFDHTVLSINIRFATAHMHNCSTKKCLRPFSKCQTAVSYKSCVVDMPYRQSAEYLERETSLVSNTNEFKNPTTRDIR